MSDDRETNDLSRVASQWGELGESDPLWAVLTDRGRKGDRWTIDEFLETGRQEINDLFTRLDSMGIDPPTGRALDFGCGAGRLTQALARRVGSCVGVDVSPGMLDRARQINELGDSCEFLLNQRDDLSAIPDSSVDFVYTCRVLQHMGPELAATYIGEFFRIARPGAPVVFQLPTRPARSFKGLGIRILPASVATKLRRGMEMHGNAEAKVRSVVADASGTVLAVDPDQSAGPGWDSRLYIARA